MSDPDSEEKQLSGDRRNMHKTAYPGEQACG